MIASSKTLLFTCPICEQNRQLDRWSGCCSPLCNAKRLARLAMAREIPELRQLRHPQAPALTLEELELVYMADVDDAYEPAASDAVYRLAKQLRWRGDTKLRQALLDPKDFQPISDAEEDDDA